MAKRPAKSSGSRLSNIMGILRGNIDFKSQDNADTTLPLGSAEIISAEEKTKILNRALATSASPTSGRGNSGANILAMVQTSLSKVGAERTENRKILQLMPEVDKAARLMVASTFAPNDLSAKEIPITFDIDFLNPSVTKKLGDKATEFFQKKLNLKKSAASWVYQFGYETGSCAFAIIPLRSLKDIQDESYLGIESFTQKVVDQIAEESLFGFGYTTNTNTAISQDAVGLENFAHTFIDKVIAESKDVRTTIPAETKKFIEQIIGQENLKLTDNPSVLQIKDTAKEKVKKRTSKVLNEKFKNPTQETIVAVPVSPDEVEPLADPILFRLPPESVTVIHTPGDPNDHIGYFVLLDQFGNPINSTTMDEAHLNRVIDSGKNQNNIFSQVYNAYGMNSGSTGYNNYDSMNALYSKIVTEHLKNRVGKAGYTNVALGSTDSMMRCMFTRFMAKKQTRVLFLPKDLVTYMAFELDQNGYGVSRLDRIKFNLGMKMAVQVSRVLATIKSAMDKRKIEVRFTENLLEQPESIFNSIMTEYMRKSTMSFSIDPNVIQNQIIDKSISIKGINMPGMEEFDLSNEPDTRSGSLDFDPTMTEYLDQQTLHGMRVPPATMNSLSQDEFSRSVATTNLFFAMDISLDQDVVIHHISDLIKKYARFSQSFANLVYEIIPTLRPDNNNESSIDSNKEKEEDPFNLPKGFTVEKLIESMSISLPRPNVAPSKAQFEALGAMIESIGQVVDALFPDELIGSDDKLSAAVRLLKAKFKTSNIREYLNHSGMSNLDVPESNFTDVMPSIIDLQDAISNIAALLENKAKLNTPPESSEESAPGYN